MLWCRKVAIFHKSMIPSYWGSFGLTLLGMKLRIFAEISCIVLSQPLPLIAYSNERRTRSTVWCNRISSLLADIEVFCYSACLSQNSGLFYRNQIVFTFPRFNEFLCRLCSVLYMFIAIFHSGFAYSAQIPKYSCSHKYSLKSTNFWLKVCHIIYLGYRMPQILYTWGHKATDSIPFENKFCIMFGITVRLDCC